MNLVDPKIDLVFKHIFGSSEHPLPLLDLINAVLESHDETPLTNIQVLNPHIDPTTLSDKQVIFDIKARTGEAEPINVEIQIVNQYNWRGRSLYYWSKMYTEQLEKGESYRKLQKTISISFLNYQLFDRERCHSLYEVLERHDKQPLSDHLQMYYIEIPKLTAQTQISSSLRNWLKFLTVEEEDDLAPIRHTTPALEEACNMLAKMSSSDEQRALADARRKAILDYNTNMEGAWEEGKKQGLEQGIEQGIEQGKEQGLFLGEVKILSKLLSKRFGSLDSETRQKLENATPEEIEIWSARIFEAQTMSDVFQ